MHTPVQIKIVGDKLVRPCILTDDSRLPCQIIRRQLPLESFEFRAKAPVDGSPNVREILPGIDTVAPVIKAEFLVEGLQVAVEFFS